MDPRSTWLTTAVLVALDLILRASYLAPRLATARGAVNYGLACVALWIVVRLVAMAAGAPRVAWFGVFVAAPMTIQWGMFRAYAQFVEPTDFVALAESPRVALASVGQGTSVLGACAVFAITLACAWLLPHGARPLRWRFIGGASVAFVSLVSAGALYWNASPTLEHPEPAFGCAIAGLVWRTVTVTANAERVKVPRAQPKTARLPNIVLVIGESLAAGHTTLYGYARDTTPRLQKLENEGALLALRDATVMGPSTRTSVPYIVTGLEGPDPNGRVLRAPTVIEYAHANGYHTAFISAQEESWGRLDALFREGADTFRSGIDFAPSVDVLKGADDLDVLDRGVLPALATIAEPFFIVLHMDGSHMPYGHHSPASRKVFGPEDGVNSIDAYDNTVRVTDEYVARTFEALRARDPEAWMFFTSDHGQPLGEGGAFYNRGYQPSVLRDPLLVFPPHAADLTPWTALLDAQTEACDLAPTLLHLMTAMPALAMDCVDWLAGAPHDRIRVVSAYTAAYLDEPTAMVVLPTRKRALFDLHRMTVTIDDGELLAASEFPLPPEVAARAKRR